MLLFGHFCGEADLFKGVEQLFGTGLTVHRYAARGQVNRDGVGHGRQLCLDGRLAMTATHVGDVQGNHHALHSSGVQERCTWLKVKGRNAA